MQYLASQSLNPSTQKAIVMMKSMPQFGKLGSQRLAKY